MAKPKKCISPQDAKSLFTHWQNTRGAGIRSHIGEEDTCEFALSIAELREYLDYVEDESKNMGITNPGVRLYFGAYNGSNSNKATFFMAPTKGKTITRGGDDEEENNYDIDPFNTHTGGWPPKNYNP